ncbi:10375_t:CDS:2, partial [Funneliformis geosporum]
RLGCFAFHIKWIRDNERNPVNLAYDKSDALAKSLRVIVNKYSDDKKVTKAKSLLDVIKAIYGHNSMFHLQQGSVAFSYSSDGLLARCSLWFLSDQRKKGNDIDKLWLTIENKMCALQIDKERMNLEILQARKSVKSDLQPGNGRSSSESLLSDESNKEHDEDDMEIKFDLTRFQPNYNVNRKSKYDTYLNFDSFTTCTLQFASVLVGSWPHQWLYHRLLSSPGHVQSLLSPEILSSLNEASFNHFLGMDAFMEGGKSKLSRLCYEDCSVKIVRCLHFVYPIARPFFVGDEKEYDLVLNRSNAGSKKRPDLSCVINGVPILNSEFKPLGSAPLQRMKDRLKVKLKARKSINQQLQSKGGPGEAVIFLNMGDLMEPYSMDLKYDGLYRSWPFLTTRLVVDKACRSCDPSFGIFR